jgi:hypothetical protein
MSVVISADNIKRFSEQAANESISGMLPIGTPYVENGKIFQYFTYSNMDFYYAVYKKGDEFDEKMELLGEFEFNGQVYMAMCREIKQ